MGGLSRREEIFEKFSGQLNLLKLKGYLTIDLKYDKTYICPICLRQFSKDDVKESKNNYLTLEDAPPDSLGGKKIALTCKECNSTCGHTIDFHLTEAIREIDASYFYPGSVQNRKIKFEDSEINVELTSKGNGVLQAYHRIKNNNPKLLDRFFYGLKSKDVRPLLNLNPPKSKVENKKVNYALVKTNYIITFARFGYIFLLHPSYNDIRSQLLNPEQNHYPWTPFVKDQFPKDAVGTHYIINPKLESILNIFCLKTEYSETLIGGTLPLPCVHTQEHGRRIDTSKTSDNHLVLDTKKYDREANLFTDWPEIQKVINWIVVSCD